MERRYTKDLLAPVVRKSKSYAEVIRRLGARWSGGIQALLKRRITEYGISTDHFLGQFANCGTAHVGGSKKRTWREILVKRESFDRTKAVLLRRALIEMGRPYRCEGPNCTVQSGEWLGKPLVLNVDHIDRDYRNSLPTNVRFLCPNCHAQTAGHSGSKGFTGIASEAEKMRQYRRRKGQVVKLVDAPV